MLLGGKYQPSECSHLSTPSQKRNPQEIGNLVQTVEPLDQPDGLRKGDYVLERNTKELVRAFGGVGKQQTIVFSESSPTLIGITF